MSTKEIFKKLDAISDIIIADTAKARENGASEEEIRRLQEKMWKHLDSDNLREQYNEQYRIEWEDDMKKLRLCRNFFLGVIIFVMLIVVMDGIFFNFQGCKAYWETITNPGILCIIGIILLTLIISMIAPCMERKKWK